MSNEQILKQAIAKAVKNGWSGPFYSSNQEEEFLNIMKKSCLVIFDHDFAKAFWQGTPTDYKIHLQEMVKYEEPLKYIAKFL